MFSSISFLFPHQHSYMYHYPSFPTTTSLFLFFSFSNYYHLHQTHVSFQTTNQLHQQVHLEQKEMSLVQHLLTRLVWIARLVNIAHLVLWPLHVLIVLQVKFLKKVHPFVLIVLRVRRNHRKVKIFATNV